MLKRVLLIALVVVLFLLPIVARRFTYFEGTYEPDTVERPNLESVSVPTPEVPAFADRTMEFEPGTVLVDVAHANRFEERELNVLQSRLAARGQRIELLQDAEELAGHLRSARALIVISPGNDWTPDEIKLVRRFVDKGGRLLLITDPTRYELDWDLFILDYDSTHINDLAAEFGMVFRSGYLYNTAENVGNFRNIALSTFASHDLTAGLERVVFYSAGSIDSEEVVLIAAAGQTRSSNSQGAEELPVAVLAESGAVLGLSDFSFMIEGNSGTYDNASLVANIADFVSGAERQYALADFPLFFGDRTTLVFAGSPLLNGALLQGGGDLQALFEDVGRQLTISEVEDKAQDALFLGLYEEAEAVEPYLAQAGVTLVLSPTDAITATDWLTVTPGFNAGQEITSTAGISPGLESRVRIESWGEMMLTGTSLLLLQTDGERQVLVALANTGAGVESAVERLSSGELSSCLMRETEEPVPTTLALCATDEEAADAGGGWPDGEQEAGETEETEPGEPEPEPEIEDSDTVTDTIEPPEEPAGSILVVALDLGQGRYDSMTSAEEYAEILRDRYLVTVWYASEEGELDVDQVLEYDLTIWTFGDFEFDEAFGDDEADGLLTVMYSDNPFIMSGAYIGGAGVDAVQRDIQIEDATHPVVEGFDDGEVIALVPAPSGQEYETSVIDEVEAEAGTVLFVRGPESDEAGAPSIVIEEDSFTGQRIGLIGLPLYLLPEDVRSDLVLNMANWMVGP